MRWWSHLWRSSAKELGEPLRQVCLTVPGWSQDTPQEGGRIWRDIDGNVLSLDMLPEPFRHADSANETKVRKWCRKIAERASGGLIEAYVYIGVLITYVRKVWLIWTMVAGERGPTGVREAVVTAKLMNQGKLTIDGYKR